jgi:predicted SAM-dependent methyltransferase
MNQRRAKKRMNRRLEIGPGKKRIPGYETINIAFGFSTDYIGDAAKKLPFESSSFIEVYASHILEHVPWFKTRETLQEWFRVLKPGGTLKVFVPDGTKIVKTLVALENNQEPTDFHDPWYRFNAEKDLYTWANGRIFSYGNGTSDSTSQNWHRSLFTKKSLTQQLQKVGFIDIQEIRLEDCPQMTHGWISLNLQCRKAENTAR